MDRFNSSETGSLGRKVWRRYCPGCAAFTSAAPAEPQGPYEGLVRSLFGKQYLECTSCGTRLRETVPIRRRRSARAPADGASRFLTPSDDRDSSQLLRELKDAETSRHLAPPVRGGNRERSS